MMKNFLKNGFAQMNIPCSDTQIGQFIKYYEILIDYNTRVNLTRITEPDEVCVKHFFDSASLLNAVEIQLGAVIIDVGTGAGFPGLPLKILRPDIRLTLLDSLNKRVEFLKFCAQELGINDGITFVHGRAEDCAAKPEYRERCNIAVSRAVANLSTLSEYCLPFVKTGGIFAALKGPEPEAELKTAARAIKLLGGANARITDAEIPESKLRHTIIIVDKTSPTPAIYPRSGARPTKNPL